MADEMTSGTLYVIATPIGNLEDISIRALRLLKESDIIAAEDTRVTRKLLSHFDIHTPLTSYHQHSLESRSDSLLEALERGENIALVSDAGLPGISDPGTDLIARAIKRGFCVTPVPGANAALTALVASGLPTARFAFDGFPPRSRSDRHDFFNNLKKEQRTILLYESPGRLLNTLQELLTSLGDAPISVARELTKLFEEHYRGTISQAIAYFTDKKPRGEFTLVIHPLVCLKYPNSDEMPTPEEALQEALLAGLSGRDAIAQVSENLRLPKKKVYSLLLQIKSKS